MTTKVWSCLHLKQKGRQLRYKPKREQEIIVPTGTETFTTKPKLAKLLGELKPTLSTRPDRPDHVVQQKKIVVYCILGALLRDNL